MITTPSSLSAVRKRVLTVEDDRHLLATLEYILIAEGYEVLTARDGVTSLEIARTHYLDLIILDLNLPELDGESVCRALRDEGNQVPILVLTARQSADDAEDLINLGADDYVRKPFELGEFTARVRRRIIQAAQRPRVVQEEPSDEHMLNVGELQVDFAKRKAYKDDRPVVLRPREFDILNCLASRKGRAVSRNQILSDVWGEDFRGGPRTVDVHISMLRRKLEDDHTDPDLIVTVHGTGYKLNT